ncbi:MAG: hypothetical protein JXO22_12660, partial [Phycisphaerae bacterium]|nr:hypothetical protein [Phycisphaerae bacterium]
MMLRNASLAKRIFIPTLGLFIVSMVVLFGVQYELYVRSFETTLANIQDSSLAVKRDAALGMMQGVRVSAERMLQTGEYRQFTEYADSQCQHTEAETLAFVDASGKVVL